MSGSPQQLPLGDLHADWHPKHPWLVAMTVMLATFMEVLDTSIANVSLPNIAGNLSAGVDESTWVLTSYLVSNAIILPLAGWFASLFGRKRFFMACVGLFVVSSFLCGFAPNLGSLVFFRILQGAGGGSMQPLAQAILVESFPRHKRGMAMAVYAMGVVVAPIVGPTVGGWITDSYSWRWIFYINVPIGIVSLLMTSSLVQDPPYLVRKKLGPDMKIDYVGLGLLSVGLGALQVVLDKGQREDWLESNFIAVLAAVSGVSLLAVLVWELRQKEPVADFHLLKDRNFAISTVTMFLLGFVLYGSTALLPIFCQTLMGYTAMLSGLVLSPGALVTLLALPVAGKLLGRFQPRWLVMVGVAALSSSMLMMGRFSLDVDFHTMMIARLVMGLGMAFLFVPINTMAFDFVPRARMSHATGLINLARNMGGSCGIAFVTTMLARYSQVHQTTLVAHLSPLEGLYRTNQQALTSTLAGRGAGAVQATQQGLGVMYGEMARQASMLSFVDVFNALGYLFLLLVPLLLMMKKTQPHKPGPAAQ